MFARRRFPFDAMMAAGGVLGTATASVVLATSADAGTTVHALHLRRQRVIDASRLVPGTVEPLRELETATTSGYRDTLIGHSGQELLRCGLGEDRLEGRRGRRPPRCRRVRPRLA